MDLPPPRQFHAMQTVEPRQQRVRVLLDVRMIQREYAPEELVLVVVDRLDDEAVVPREIKERAGFARGAEFGEDVFGGEGEEVVGWVEVEVFFSQSSEDPGCVVFELEVVLG